MNVFLDFETRSHIDLVKVGAFRYAEHLSTEIMCLAYALDDGPVQLWRPGDGSACLEPLYRAVLDGAYLLAWNAQFESVIWSLLPAPPPVDEQRWVCVAALAARANLPRNLGTAAEVLRVSHQKNPEGRRLMLRLCKPSSQGRFPEPTTAERAKLEDYCMRDVETERATFRALPRVGHPLERALYLLDRKINARGIGVDLPLTRGALHITEAATENINARVQTVTDGAIQTVNQVAAITQWAQDRGAPVLVLDKATVRDALPDMPPGPARDLLLLRQEGGRSSTAKLRTILRTVGRDGRVRGSLLYYGAGTGRWAGRGIQPQNFYRPSFPVSEDLVGVVTKGDIDLLAAVLPEGRSVLECIASMLRSCLVAGEGKEFTVADFSAIEARVLAWLAGARGLLSAFQNGRSPYLDMGRVIFGRAISKTEDSKEYHVAKNTVLGCGYQMGWETYRDQAQKQTGTLLPDELCQRAVAAYRRTYPEVPAFWKRMNRACQEVVLRRVPEWVAVSRHLAFRMDPSGWLTMRLPSGRCLWYPAPRMSKRMAPWGEEVEGVTCAGVLPQSARWGRYALYGGLLTENAVQAVARDLMGEAMLRVEAAGYPVVLTVHDEIVTEHDPARDAVADFEALVAQVPPWAEGCPVAAEGWRGTRYRK